mgnify:FL=1
MKYSIRFNKTRGEPGRGTKDHVWRVFENDTEYLFKHFKLNVPCFDETDGYDWNVCCYGFMTIDRETSTAIINGEEDANISV